MAPNFLPESVFAQSHYIKQQKSSNSEEKLNFFQVLGLKKSLSEKMMTSVLRQCKVVIIGKKCTACGKTFKCKTDLDVHQRNRHRVKKNTKLLFKIGGKITGSFYIQKKHVKQPQFKYKKRRLCKKYGSVEISNENDNGDKSDSVINDIEDSSDPQLTSDLNNNVEEIEIIKEVRVNSPQLPPNLNNPKESSVINDNNNNNSSIDKNKSEEDDVIILNERLSTPSPSNSSDAERNRQPTPNKSIPVLDLIEDDDDKINSDLLAASYELRITFQNLEDSDNSNSNSNYDCSKYSIFPNNTELIFNSDERTDDCEVIDVIDEEIEFYSQENDVFKNNNYVDKIQNNLTSSFCNESLIADNPYLVEL